MPPADVKPYLKPGKTDAIDADAIGEAVTRPKMRFVPVKSPERAGRIGLRAGTLPIRATTYSLVGPEAASELQRGDGSDFSHE
jgi:transposase